MAPSQNIPRCLQFSLPWLGTFALVVGILVDMLICSHENLTPALLILGEQIILT